MGSGPASTRDEAGHTPSFLSPARSIELAGLGSLVPYQQGALDTLCGLLSAINALRLALAEFEPLTRAACKDLFAEGVTFLHRKHSLAVAATEGMSVKRWHALARHLARRVSGHSVQVTIEQAQYREWASIVDAFAWIDASLVSGKPVLIWLKGGMDHFTVVAGSTAATFKLFDSTGMRFVRKASCGLSGKFHSIPPHGLLRIAVEKPG